MPILEGATGIHIYGGNFNDVAGDHVSVNRDYIVHHHVVLTANTEDTTPTNPCNDPTDNDRTDSGSEHSTDPLTGGNQDGHQPQRQIEPSPRPAGNVDDQDVKDNEYTAHCLKIMI